MGRFVTGLLFFVTIIVAVATVIFIRSGQDTDAPRTITVERRDVTQDVSFTGRLQSQGTAELSFEVAGTISEVLVDVGDEVEPGQVLARLNTTATNLAIAKANADQVATEEETRRSWQKTEDEWVNTKAANDQTLATKRQDVTDAKAELDQDRATFAQTVNENGDDSSVTGTAEGTVLAATTKWNAAKKALDESIKTTNKSTASARAAADVAKAKYKATKQTAPSVAGLSSLQATEALARYKITQSTILAPFPGIITTREADPDEYATAGTTIVTVQTVGSLELTADVPETDAVKLASGLPATVTFDAFSLTNQWSATISRTAPAAKIIEGVPTYQITLQLDNSDQRLKAGLTANITVHADFRAGVFAIPRRAVISRGTEQFVRLLSSDGQITEQAITTGLIGSDGAIEVVSGLSARDQVITSALTNATP